MNLMYYCSQANTMLEDFENGYNALMKIIGAMIIVGIIIWILFDERTKKVLIRVYGVREIETKELVNIKDEKVFIIKNKYYMDIEILDGMFDCTSWEINKSMYDNLCGNDFFYSYATIKYYFGIVKEIIREINLETDIEGNIKQVKVIKE